MNRYLPIFLLLLFSPLFAQEKPKARQVADLPRFNCEVLGAELDILLNELTYDPSASGIIVVTGKRGDLRNNLLNEAIIKSGYALRKFPLFERWRIVRASLGEAFTAQFWLVPSGADLPVMLEQDWSYELPANAKPFFFFDSGEADSREVCWAVDGLSLLSEVLVANPRSKTNVVLRVNNLKEYRRRETATLKRLTQDFLIPRRRIRVYMVRRSPSDKFGIEPDAEYWLVPPKPNQYGIDRKDT